ncbi:uroporphyrinogen-III C-methyltransferase [Amphritea balenae]|uniref:Heme biosynthesis protein n=1 Tax=Amphritea balenae TaxID=452629 RepID=A0A3P1SMC6_9GAMM|nr:uroporphyrinogen-III C-methyltransferase [Amphritea balenae]RRC97422.1 heme biosynthesis protein [Amphritea balenae]GGK84289.1 heme biosynthesis operon protein HemX [Amphritea balenae]
MKKSGNNNPDTSGKKEDVIEGELIDKESIPAEPNEKAQGSEADNPPEAAPKADKPAKQPAGWPGKLALLLALIAIVGVVYLYWMQMQAGNQLAQSQQQTNSSVDKAIAQSQQQTDQKLTSLSKQLSSLENNAQQEQANISELQDRLTRSIKQVTAEQKNTQKDWLLAEVEYLLRLANQRVLMEQTPQGALQLLRSADKILSETDDVTIYEIRKAVAADIAALEAVPALDTEGVFLRLGALNAQVTQLQVIPLTEQHKLPEIVGQVTSEDFASSWSEDVKQAWAKVSDKFNQLVVIQDRSEPIEPLLSPQQSYYLQQNLHLMLEQAQLSLLQRKQKSYQNSLTKAQSWVSTYFEQNHSNTQALLKALKGLEEVEVAPEMPDISGSLAALKGYLKDMRKLKEGAA